MDSNNENIGEKIRKIRKLKGFSQKELATKTGIAQNSIGNYERGERSPTMAVLEKIATALAVDLSELVDLSVSDEVITRLKNRDYELSNKIKIQLNLIRTVALQEKIENLLVQIKESLSQPVIDGEKVRKLMEEKDSLKKEVHDLQIQKIKEPDYQRFDLDHDIDYHLISIYTGIGCIAETLELLFNNSEINPLLEESKIFEDIIRRFAFVGFENIKMLFKDNEINYWVYASSVFKSIKNFLDDKNDSEETLINLKKSISDFFSLDGVEIKAEIINEKLSRLNLLDK